MNQTQLIDAIHDQANKSTSLPKIMKSEIKRVLEVLGQVATVELYGDGEVTLPSLGKLGVKVRAAREGRNPATGETIQIPVKRVPHFNPAKALKDAVAPTN